MSSTNDTAYVARQPILDPEGLVWAYELLFRASASGQAGTIDDDVYATSRMLVNAISAVGMDRLLGGRKAFINCSWRLLQEELVDDLDPERFVLEILETSTPEAQLLEDVKRLHGAGFSLALDDFIFDKTNLHAWQPFFPFVQWIKVDLKVNTPQQCLNAARYFHDTGGPLLLAEKVETREEFRQLKAAGYRLFQGWFFARPEVLSGRTLDPGSAGILSLIQKLRTEPDTQAIEEIFRHEPELTMLLLRYLNSAAFGMRREIRSVRQALTLIGQRKLQQWLTLLLYSRPGARKISPALQTLVLSRARLMELSALQISGNSNHGEQAFLCGLLSGLDVITGISLRELLCTFPVDSDIQEAILEARGLLGQLLTLALETEHDNRTTVPEVLVGVGLDDSEFRHILLESYSWAEEFSAAMA